MESGYCVAGDVQAAEGDPEDSVESGKRPKISGGEAAGGAVRGSRAPLCQQPANVAAAEQVTRFLSGQWKRST